MLYQKPKFSVPASAGTESLCASVGQHAMRDTKGRCLRCGARVSERAQALAFAPSGINAETFPTDSEGPE